MAAIKKKLINELNNMAPPQPVQFIRDVDDIPSALTRHDLMIICDTNCSDNEQFLAKVRFFYNFFICNILVVYLKSGEVFTNFSAV